MRRALIAVTVAVAAIAMIAIPISSAAAPHALPSVCGINEPAPAYQHVVLVLMENNSYGSIIGNGNAPWINSITKACGLATNDHNTTHNSLPNYLALTSGMTIASLQPFVNDCLPSSCTSSAPSIFGQGESQRSYAESMPSNCDRSNAGTYAPKHVPAVYYPALTSCSSTVVPLGPTAAAVRSVPAAAGTCPSTVKAGASGATVTLLQGDLNRWGAKPPVTVNGTFAATTTTAVDQLKAANGLAVDGVAGPKVWGVLGECAGPPPTTTTTAPPTTTTIAPPPSPGILHDFGSEATAPAFSFVTPNLCSDMHDCSVATGDHWLQTFVNSLTATAVYQSGATAIFIVWDEGEPGSAGENCDANQSDQSCHVALLVVAPSVAHGATVAAYTNHYTLLHAIESMLGLPQLGVTASPASMLAGFNL